MEPLLIILSLLTISIITLVFIIVWRDRRDLKISQVTKEITRAEELLKEIQMSKTKIEEMLATANKRTDQAVSKVDNQVKQVRDSVAKLEHQMRSGKKDFGREKEKQQKYSGRGKARPSNTKQREQAAPNSRDRRDNRDNRDKPEPKINDGVKFAKMVEMADKGLSTQEIAKKLNMGCSEVELVLELKRKNIS